jgi:hypothetical protein
VASSTSKRSGNQRFTRESARSLLTGALFAMVLFTIEIAFLGAFLLGAGGEWTKIEQLLRVALPVEAGLLALALRFYFNHGKRD